MFEVDRICIYIYDRKIFNLLYVLSCMYMPHLVCFSCFYRFIRLKNEEEKEDIFHDNIYIQYIVLGSI